MIEIQDAYVARLLQAHAKITARTKGDRFRRTRTAARKDAVRRLTRKGFDEAAALQIVRDAHDVFLLEVGARDE